MKKNLTPKKRVLKRHVGAYSYKGHYTPTWYIWSPTANRVIGSGNTAALAWANAAESL